MKHLQAYAAAIMALLVIGCAGSGNNTPTVPTNNLGTPRLEAIVRVTPASLQHPDNFTDDDLLDPTNQAVYNDLIPAAKTVFGYQDPLNFQAGENFVFQLAAYDQSTGKRVVLPASFRTSDTLGTFGQITENAGSFQASNTPTADNQTVFAVYNGTTYQVQYAVKPRQARVIGKVLTTDANAPVGGVQLNFYTNTGLFVGQVTTAPDGSYRASVPSSASQYTVIGNTIPSAEYRVFTFNSLTFDASNADCRAPLPALFEGTQVLPDILLTPRSQTQPDLSGCPGF